MWRKSIFGKKMSGRLMGAHESEAMRKARELVLVQGVAPSKAAQQSGISISAICKANWYREWRIKKEEAK
jgi:hypothetical protein